jgi:hypothetical protein
MNQSMNQSQITTNDAEFSDLITLLVKLKTENWLDFVFFFIFIQITDHIDFNN